MEHPPVPYINPTVAHARCVIGAFEKHKVAGPGGAYRGTQVIEPLGSLAAHIPAGMVDNPR